MNLCAQFAGLSAEVHQFAKAEAVNGANQAGKRQRQQVGTDKSGTNPGYHGQADGKRQGKEQFTHGVLLTSCGKPPANPEPVPAEHPVQRVTKTALPRSSGGTSRPLWPGWGFAPVWSIGARIVVQEPWEYGKNTVRYTRPSFDQTRRPIRPGGPASGPDLSSIFEPCPATDGCWPPLCVAAPARH